MSMSSVDLSWGINQELDPGNPDLIIVLFGTDTST